MISDARQLIWSVLLAILVVAAAGVQGELVDGVKAVILGFVGRGKPTWSTSPEMACTAITSRLRVGPARVRLQACSSQTISSKLY